MRDLVAHIGAFCNCPLTPHPKTHSTTQFGMSTGLSQTREA